MKSIALKCGRILGMVTMAIAGVDFSSCAQADTAGAANAFTPCAACHNVTGDEGLGPHLDGVIGRKAGSVAGYNYSRQMKQANIVWNDETLGAFIADPQSVVPGNRMPFAGLQDPAVRIEIINYLKTLH